MAPDDFRYLPRASHLVRRPLQEERLPPFRNLGVTAYLGGGKAPLPNGGYFAPLDQMPKRNWASCAQKKNCAACDAGHMPPKAVWCSLILAHVYAREFSDEGGEVGLGPDGTNVAIHESSLLCTVSKERGRDMAQIALLKDKFGLTPAESRLVLRLMAGDTLRSSAAALGVGYETARTTLKAVFRNTVTCRQTELAIVTIRAMAALPSADARTG